MNIISIYPINGKQEGWFKETPMGVFIEPFYGGDNIHHLTLITDWDFRDRLQNHTDLIVKCGRTDMKPLLFDTKQEAEAFAHEKVFGNYLKYMNDNGL